MRDYRDRPTRYRHYFRLWLLMFAINLLLFWASHNGWVVIWYLIFTPFIFGLWEIGERARDLQWEHDQRRHPDRWGPDQSTD